MNELAAAPATLPALPAAAPALPPIGAPRPCTSRASPVVGSTAEHEAIDRAKGLESRARKAERDAAQAAGMAR